MGVLETECRSPLDWYFGLGGECTKNARRGRRFRGSESEWRQGCRDAELAGIRWDPARLLDQMPVSFPRKATDRKRTQRQKYRCDEFFTFSDEAVS
jgi:hypothetical protein